MGCLSPASPFLILEASVGLSQLLEPGKGSGFSSRGGSQGSCRCYGAIWPPGVGGGAREVLLAPPLRLRGGLRAGRSACAVTWTSRARAQALQLERTHGVRTEQNNPPPAGCEGLG